MPRQTKPAEEATTTTVGATTAILAPVDGMIVLDPARPGHPLPAAGRAVPLTSYWLRRIADGDVRRVADGDVVRVAEGDGTRATDQEQPK